MTTIAEPQTGFAPMDIRTGRECRLAMQDLQLMGEILLVGARLRVVHRFMSAEKKPIEVVYGFGLPRDACLRRFRVEGDGFSVRSELKPVKEAQKDYEEAIEAGHLATMTRQYGDGLVNLNLGNIRPGETVTVKLELVAGVELRDDGLRFRFPFTLAPCYHREARGYVDETGAGVIELPENGFDDLILPSWSRDAQNLHRVGFDLNVCMPGGIGEIASPSHKIRVANTDDTTARIRLATELDVPNRDLVLDIRSRQTEPVVLAGIDGEGKGRFAAVIPSTSFGVAESGPRRVVFVVDRSGSMNGRPMEQARKAVEACLGALSPEDQFGIVAFDSSVDVFRKRLLPGTMENREAARGFLRTVDARGGTELLQGVSAGSQILGNSGGELLVMTDGQVYAGEDIIQQAKSPSVRIHCLGIGSASQDRFLSLLASETSGVSRFLTPRERVDVAAVELFASIGRPVATNVRCRVEGTEKAAVAPAPSPVIFSGSPLSLFGSSKGTDKGSLIVSWDGNGKKELQVPLSFEESRYGQTLKLVQGAKIITEVDAGFAETTPNRRTRSRENSRLTRRLEKLAAEYGLANRCMALVAVVERESDEAGETPEIRIVPVGMPEGVDFLAYFQAAEAPMYHLGAAKEFARFPCCTVEPSPPLPLRVADSMKSDEERYKSPAGPEETLIYLAGKLEQDGGMPGDDVEQRVLGSLLGLLFFIENDNSLRNGVFRLHVQRLVAFLERIETSDLDPDQIRILNVVIEGVRSEHQLPGGWEPLVDDYLIDESLSADDAWQNMKRMLRDLL